MPKPPNYWNLERCREIALQYKTRVAWRQGHETCYRAAYRNGWLDACTTHMENSGKRKRHWTLEKCKEEALKFKSRSEWKKEGRTSYAAAQRLGIIEECAKHMERPNKGTCKELDSYWTFDRCKKYALEYNTRAAWAKKHEASYKAAAKRGWLDKCCAHMITAEQTAENLALYGAWK